MNFKRCLSTIGAVTMMFGFYRVAHANSISPYVYFWPGIISIAVMYAFPASLLAAFIERPFLTYAGIRRRPLVLSLRANFVSTIVGIVLIPIGYPALYVLGPVWCLAAFCISCFVEISYHRRFSHQSFTWSWAIGGNAASSLTLMLLPVVAIAIAHNQYALASSLEPHQTWLILTSLGTSVIVFLVSFAVPIAGTKHFSASDADSSPHTFDSDQPAAPAGRIEAENTV